MCNPSQHQRRAIARLDELIQDTIMHVSPAAKHFRAIIDDDEWKRGLDDTDITELLHFAHGLLAYAANRYVDDADRDAILARYADATRRALAAVSESMKV